MQLELFFERGQPLFQLLREPPGKIFRFGKRQFAEFRTGAGNRPARKRRSLHRQSGGSQFGCHQRGALFAHIHDQQILHDGIAHVPVGVTVGEMGGEVQLLWSDAPTQRRRAHVDQARLLLGVHTNVVAMNIGWRFFPLTGVQGKPDLPLQFREKRVGGPAMFQKKKFEASFFPALAQHFTGAENFGDSANHR